MKKDKYLRARDGKAKMITISCAKCSKKVLDYQKDGTGYLHRCYLNRIINPENLSRLQYEATITKPSEMPKLICDCGNLIGVPMKHSDGRLAFLMERGTYSRKLIKHNK